MMEMRQLKWPMPMAVDCIVERAKLLVAYDRAGWARVPTRPGDVIVVDKQGCVLTDLDGEPIKPWIGANTPIPAPNSTGTIASAFKLQVAPAEGNITHIYGDTGGRPTVGIGHLIKGEQDLLAIHERFGFYKRRDDGEPGTEKADFEDVLRDYRKIETLHLHGQPAHDFWQFTTVDLMLGDIIRLRDQDIEEHLGYLLHYKKEFPNYLSYPLGAQLALLDMSFNRGNRTVREDYPPFIEAIQNRNWMRAAEASSKVGKPSETRQAAISSLFKQAAAIEPYFIDPECSKPILHVRDAMFL